MSTSMYRAYRSNLFKYWPYYLAGTASLLITTCSEVLIPKFIQWSIDLLTNSEAVPALFQQDGKRETLDVLIASLLLTLTIGWIGRIGWRQLLARQTHSIGHQLKTQFWDALKHQPLSFLQRYSLGDLMNRATGDWNKSRFIHGFTMVFSFDVVFFICLSLVSMLMIDVWLTLASLFIVPFLPRRIIKLSKMEYAQHQTAQETLSELSDMISQSVQTVRLQRSTATEGSWFQQLSKRAKGYAYEQFEVLKIGWKIFIIGAIPTIIAYGVLFSFGIYKYQNGDISIGEFLAMQSYVLLLQSPLFELGSVISEWQTGFASFSRVHEILAQKKSPNTGLTEFSQTEASAISLEDLSFNYPKQETGLKNLNIDIVAGEMIGITGSIGAGKSTLLNLISGLQENYSGKIKLFGQDLKALDAKFISDSITVVPQKPFLFSGSIRHNIELASQFSDEHLEEVLKAVRLWDDIQDMPDRLDTWIGEWGINLSGGQKQRLAIARALTRDSRVLILDDALSAVDSVTEEHILKALETLFANKTIIWTAHRSSTLQLCNTLYELKNGSLNLVKG